MADFTKSETAAINTAWRSIRELCSRTNWSDGPQWESATKLERAQTGNLSVARAMCCKAWAEGLDNPDRAARSLYRIRPGYLSAFLLGVRHAVERRGGDYNGPLVEECHVLCDAAIAANEAHTARIVEGE